MLHGVTSYFPLSVLFNYKALLESSDCVGWRKGQRKRKKNKRMREGERKTKASGEKNDISILRPVLPVSGLISQCLWGAECNQSALVSSRSSSILNQGRRIPKLGGERNITGKLVLD